eukprot:c7473_g1_i1.p1 GENE.c7473_g1_i1~~c7473_g1_i1.p1  ORF type:complete len:354 (+),score=38.39 c7473_g1_i1:160-1221(+)
MRKNEKDSIRVLVMSLWKQKKTHKEILKAVGPSKISLRTVQRYTKRFSENGGIKDKQRSGRPRSVRTKKFLKALRESFRRNPQRSQKKLSQKYKCSPSTIQNAIKQDLEFRPFKKKKVPFVTTKARLKRMERSKDLSKRHDFNDNIDKVLFSDEKLFTIEEKHNPQNVRVYGATFSDIPDTKKFVSRQQHPKSVMVWAGVSCQGFTELVFIPEGVKINAQSYKKLVLIPHVLPLTEKMFNGENWCFQQDSAPAHKSKVVQKWLTENIPSFVHHNEWPPNSPDLNPMDFYVWSRLEEMVNTKRFNSVDSLKTALQRAWKKMSKEETCKAIFSVPRRLKKCVQAKGFSFEYDMNK